MAFKKIDLILLGTAAILVIFGILALASVSAKISQEKFGNTYYFLNHQLLYGILPGLVLGYLAFRINLNFLKKWALIFFLGNLVLMSLVFFPKIGLSKTKT